MRIAGNAVIGFVVGVGNAHQPFFPNPTAAHRPAVVFQEAVGECAAVVAIVLGVVFMVFMVVMVVMVVVILIIVFRIEVRVIGNIIIISASMKPIDMKGELTATEIESSGGKLFIGGGVALCGHAPAVAVLGDGLGDRG